MLMIPLLVKSQGVRPAIGCLSIIFGRSQILPSCPLFTVAYVINLFTLKLSWQPLPRQPEVKGRIAAAESELKFSPPPFREGSYR